MKTLSLKQLGQVVSEATKQIHEEIENSEAFAGYDGDYAAFCDLYQQVEVISLSEVGVKPTVEEVVERFYEIQLEICEGEREARWYA